MNCKNCGRQLDENVRFCEGCGAKVDIEAAEAAREVETEVKAAASIASAPASIPAGLYANPQAESISRIAMPMKWHKFLVYFLLWFSGVVNIINGISVLAGWQYSREFGDGAAKFVYAVLPALKPIDVIYGILIIGTAIFGFITAYRLLYKLKGSPKLLLMLYAAGAVISIIYLIVIIVILKKFSNDHGVEFDSGSFILQAIWTAVMSVLMIVVNRIYYKKRKYLFVN